MFKEFKQFIARGNVIDLAVGVIIGAAFTSIVKSLVSNIINPLIGIFIGKIDLLLLCFFQHGGVGFVRDRLPWVGGYLHAARCAGNGPSG